MTIVSPLGTILDRHTLDLGAAGSRILHSHTSRMRISMSFVTRLA